MKHFAKVLTLAMAALTISVATLAPAHADPTKNFVPTGSTLSLIYRDADGYGTMTIDVTAKNAGTDDVDVTIEQNGVAVSGSGTMRELPSFFALDCWLDDGFGGEYHFVGQIYRGSGEGHGKYQESGSSFWNHWYTEGFAP
jgi:hypothetical protein